MVMPDDFIGRTVEMLGKCCVTVGGRKRDQKKMLGRDVTIGGGIGEGRGVPVK